ncbi:MAG: flagellin [Deltaproteobacteria bacterium]|nr:flagellin [Deltaproteobacteria bacterium]
MAVDSIRNTRQLNKTLNDQKNVFEKLASGKRINKASDDAAGLAIADALASSVRSLGRASANVADATSVIQIADGALQQVGEIGTRLKELAIQSSNGTLSDDQRTALNNEFQALTAEAQRITASTEFNGKQLLDGSDTAIQVGTDSDANSQIVIPGANISGTLTDISSQNIGTQAGASAALASIDSFVTAVSSTRGELGASQARIETAGNNIAVERENAAAAESRIRDADIAELVSQKVKNDILTRTGTAIAAQANQTAQTVLKLLA